MRIGLLKTWLVNIGNGFIDAGAEAALTRSLPDAEIIPLTGYGNHVADVQAEHGSISQKLGLSDSKGHLRETVTHASEFFDLDVAVLPGCVLYEHALRKYMPVLKQLAASNVPILFLGVGGGDYERETQRYVRDQLAQLEVCGFITRDPVAYDVYEDIAPITRNGIDCAFWIDQYHSPPTADASYVAATFDKIQEPDVGSAKKIVRPDHSPFEHPFEYPINDTLSHMLNGNPTVNERNLFLGDSIEDYLLVYANATETHTDRIHAAIPTLVYGNEARLYYETPRADLFEAVGLGSIQDELVEIDDENVATLREKQKDAIQEVIDAAL